MKKRGIEVEKQGYCVYESAIGRLCIRWKGGFVTRVSCVGADLADPGVATALTDEAFGQLSAYLSGVRRSFDVPMRLEGTEFQCRVWRALVQIPYGETRTYGQIAAAIGQPKATRAVGMANHRNPLMILVPCHRVVAANGALGGYAYGLELKQKLLALESGTN